MKPKPISPVMHGIIDYVFSAALLSAPHLLGLNKKVVRLYMFAAFSTVLYSAATNYPLGIKHYIPYKLHRTIDLNIIGLLALATLYKPVKNDKHAVVFNMTIIAAAISTVLLTDWNVNSNDK
jgi:hypothetical protein